MPKLYTLLCAAALLPLAAAQSCDVSTGEASCAVCAAGADVNTLSTLPRRDRSFTAVSSDLGAYTWFECETNAQGDRTCDTVEIKPDKGSETPDSPVGYIDSLALYAAVAIVMTLLSIILLFCLVLWRYCCCCCCRRSGSCKAGASFPTRRRCCMGYEHDHLSKPRYTRVSKVLAFGSMFLFLSGVCTLMYLGDVKGNKGVTNAMVSLSNAPQGFVDLSTQFTVPFANLIQSVAAITVPNFVRDVNVTLHLATNVRQATDDMHCILGHIDALPDVDAMEDFLDSVNASLTAVDGHIVTIREELTGVTTATDNINTEVSNLQGVFTSLEPQINTALSAITTTEDALTPIESLQTTLLDSSTGYVTTSLAAISSLDTNFPSSSTITEVTTSSSGSISRLTAGSMDGAPNAAERTTVLNRLITLADVYSTQLPDGAALATTLTSINTAIDDVVAADDFTTLSTAVTDLQTAVDALPTAASIDVSITALETAVDALSLDGVRAPLVSIDSIIADMPRFSVLQAELDKIRPVLDVLPCLQSATDELLSLNDTIVVLPDSVKEVTELYDDVNKTLVETVDELDGFNTTLNSAQASIDAANTTQYIADVDKMMADLAQAKADLDFAGIRAELGAMGTDATSIDTSVTASIDTFSTTLSGNRIPASDIADASAYDTARLAMAADLTARAADVAAYSMGYCGAAPLTACAVDGDCPAGTCDGVGVRRCEAVPTTACTATSDCGGGDRCLVDTATFSATSTALQASTKPDLSGAQTALDAIATDGGFDTAAMRSGLADATTSLSAVDVAGFQTALTDTSAALTEFDVSDTDATLAEVSTSIADADFAGMKSQLDEMGDTVDDLQGDTREDIDEVVDMADALVEFLYGGFLDDLLNRLGEGPLSAARADRGIVGMVLTITGVVDDASAFWSTRTTLVDNPGNLTKDVLEEDDIVRYVDIVSTDDYHVHGPLYFLASLAEVDMVSPDYFYRQGVWKDVNQVDYPDDAVCLTAECVEFTLEELNTKSVDGVTDGLLPIAVSRENLQRTVLIFPAFIVVLGVLAMASCACCRGSPKCQKIPASCMAGCILVQLPFLFLIVGLLFPLILATGDTCYGAPNLGLQYVTTYGDAACDDFLGGDGTLTACTVSMDVGSRSVNATLNIPDIYAGLAGSCPNVDPLGPVYDSVRDEVRDVPSDELEDFFEDNAGTDVELREPIKANLRTAANSLGALSSAFVSDMSTAADCAAINGALMGFKEALCCDVVGAVYWTFAAWYAMAWLMMLCGWQTGLFARKRMTTRPWGPAYSDDLMDNAVIGDMKVIKAGAPVDDTQVYPQESQMSQDVDEYGRAQSEFDGYGDGLEEEHLERPRSRQAW